ncbi:organelle RRM domain-containing protein 6, chloroplastic [Pyrus x bretschneideri]|uniref:organelle RRM domain-containing protein 6, chloroplastic n=1 Tax=Pyrus x bretschneideri TaxID=225117 RepID=UPI0005109EE1|nr:organelle RRM domain-containing protein 6, chloroplastic [Pyrus x bretschneideri]
MWAATVCFPCYAYPKRTSLSNRTVDKPLNLRVRASFFDYPLASKILVKNIPYSTSENSLQRKFSSFGQIAEVKLVKDESSRKSKGFAFIQYTNQDDAMLALENRDSQNLDGRIIYVELARPGKDAYGESPRTSGPPKKQNLPQQEEVSDCWY